MSITETHPPRSLTFTLLRLLADGEFHSGEDMARQLGMSRASVHNALHDVAQYGVLLHSVRGRGYRLSRPLCWLDKDRILDEVGEARAALCLDILDHATSSNALLLKAASQGAASGSVMAVEWQSAGRGRLGRTWYAGMGEALTFSLLWRFESGLAALSGLSLAVGVAMMRALRELGVDDAGLKWPNDVMLPSGKLAGILLEAQGDMLGPSAVVIGIGLNLAAPAEANKIGQAAGDLSACGVTPNRRNEVLGCLLKHLVCMLREFSAQGFTALRKEWETAHIHARRPVELLMPDGKRIAGIALGVTDEGALRMETADGLREFHSGEVSLRGR
jgi:BirA family biotin operon repressor/biotin-[acetyl-CoA-carboxylase] ligase